MRRAITWTHADLPFKKSIRYQTIRGTSVGHDIWRHMASLEYCDLTTTLHSHWWLARLF